MDEFENTIRQTLSSTNNFDEEKANTLRQETAEMFKDKLEKVYRYTKLCLIICIVVGGIAGACFGISASLGTRGTWGMIASAVMFLTAGQLMLTIKLWYWIVNNKLAVLREIKQLQLQIAGMTGKSEPSSD